MHKAMTNKYQTINGVQYKQEAPGAVIQVLEEARQNATRISIIYGDITSGKAWNNGEPRTGYVSKNAINLPILISGRQGLGGQCIMDASILEIKEVRGGKSLYKWSLDEALIVEETLEQAHIACNG